MPKVLPFPEHAQARVIKQQATATVRSLLDAVVELVTNSDDSYSRLEEKMKRSNGKIEIYVRREKGGKCKEFKIRDHAEGMSRKELEKAITYGEESSGFAEGKTVRGLLGRGLKESIIGLGEGEVYTRKNRKINCIKIWYDPKERKVFYDFVDIKNFDKKDPYIGKFLNSKDNGTLVKIKVKENIKIPECNKFARQIANHYALRDINSSKKRKIVLTFEDLGRQRIKRTLPIRFTPPDGTLIFEELVSVPGYKDLIQLKIWESPREIFFKKYDPCSKAGILIKTKGAILDNRLFKYENEPAAFYFWGEAYCEDIATRLVKLAKEGKESKIIDLTRKGLNWRSDYCKSIQRAIEKSLAPIIKRKKKLLESGEKIEVPSSTKKMLKSICKLLERLAKKEFKEWEGSPEPSELRVDSLIIIPTKANIEVDKPRTLSIYAPIRLIKKAGTKTSVISGSSDIKIIFPGTKCLTTYLELKLKPHPKNSDVYYNFFKVRGKELGKMTYISCKLGNQEASALVVVKKPTEKRKSKRPRFISEIVPDETSNPIQRVEYRAGIIKIYIKFPGVARYFPSGLKEVEQKEESRAILAELISEAFCKTLARRKIESGGITINPDAQIDAFNSEVNDFQKKYSDKIHNIIWRWKFE